MIGALRRILARCLPSTPAGRAAAITFFGLLAIVIISWAFFFKDEARSIDSLTRVSVVVLLILLPAVVYAVFHLWPGPPVRRTHSPVWKLSAAPAFRSTHCPCSYCWEVAANELNERSCER
jgi:hypothetical protein